MLAKLQREIPVGPYLYEPKWDGFRSLCFVDGDRVDIRSRHDRPLSRYFPEVVAAVGDLPESRLVLDGEIVLAAGDPPRFDFAELMMRLHPAASRVAALSARHPASFVAFDLLAIGDADFRERPFVERRAELEKVLGDVRGRVRLTPATTDARLATTWLERFTGAGVDGIVAKACDGRYEPGRRAMIKVKRERTADCVVAGFRFLFDALGRVAEPPRVSSLILGLYDESAALRHVGVVTQFPASDRLALVGELEGDAVALDDHPWRDGFTIGASPIGRLKGSAARWTPDMELDWVPLRPTRVAEVAFDQVDADRFRHPARFRRWRPDRDPVSCRLDQIEVDREPFADVLAASA